jgi:hypothetical protein
MMMLTSGFSPAGMVNPGEMGQKQARCAGLTLLADLTLQKDPK